MQQNDVRETPRKKREFKIEKLEQRIAPRHHCQALADAPANEAAARGIAEAQARSGCVG